MKAWNKLLDPDGRRFKPDFGPHTTQLVLAVHALQDAQWYQHLGEPTAMDERVVRVAGWPAALAMLDEHDDRYVRCGDLRGPWDEMHRCDTRHPDRHAWWIGVRKLIEAEDIKSPHTEAATSDQNILLTDYFFDFINLLMMEIVFADVTECTYFREQLQWFHAGHLPCGWDGDWPLGKMRVY
jgi:hypothetical protein